MYVDFLYVLGNATVFKENEGLIAIPTKNEIELRTNSSIKHKMHIAKKNLHNMLKKYTCSTEIEGLVSG